MPARFPDLARACALVGCIVCALPCLAQTQSAATIDAAEERARKQSERVLNFIKNMADTPRKPELIRTVRAKPAASAPAARAAAEPVAGAPANAPTTAPLPAPARTEVATQAVAPVVAETPAAAPPEAATASVAPSTPSAAAPAAAVAAAAVEPVEAPLELLEQVQPEFPRELYSSLSSGKVMVRFTVQPNGTVREPSVLTTSHRRLNRAALEAVSQWRFAPIKEERVAQVEIEFSLQ